MINLDRQKILIVIGGLDRGGCELHLLQVLPEIRNQNYDVQLFVITGEGSLLNDFRDAGISVICPHYKKPLKCYPKLLRPMILMRAIVKFLHILKSEKPDLVHCFLPASYWIAGPLTKCFSRSVLVMSRRSSNRYLMGKKWIRLYEQTLHKITDFFIANSKESFKQLTIDEGAKNDQTFLIYNGSSPIRKRQSKRLIRNSLGLPDNAIVILKVANIIQYKGHADLIEAAEILKKKAAKSWIVLCVGRDDGQMRELQKSVTEKQLENRFKFLGSRNDISDLWGIADIGVMASHQEGFPNAIIEGMALGKPFVATNVGGNSEAIIHGRTGLLVDPHSPEQMASALHKLVQFKELRERYGRYALDRQKKNFTLEQCVVGYLKFYKLALSKAKS